MIGYEALQGELSNLQHFVEKDVTKNALKSTARMVEQRIRALAPHRTGKMKAALKVRMGRSKKGYTSVLLTLGKKFFQGDSFYGAFQEMGWKSGKRGGGKGDTKTLVTVMTGKYKGTDRFVKQGKARRQIAGEHFMEYGFLEAKDSAMAHLVSELKKGIEAEYKK